MNRAACFLKPTSGPAERTVSWGSGHRVPLTHPRAKQSFLCLTRVSPVTAEPAVSVQAPPPPFLEQASQPPRTAGPAKQPLQILTCKKPWAVTATFAEPGLVNLLH